MKAGFGEERGLAAAGIAGWTLLVLLIVLRSAWLSEDSFITLRHVHNLLHGYGPVFNPGEAVQGYTHPLWFLLLTAATSLVGSEMLAALLLGLALTMGLLLCSGRLLQQTAPRPAAALGVFTVLCALLVSSDSWVSFQTGGLENALAHFLILLMVRELLLFNAERPGRLVLLLSLLCLTRPDYFFFCLPAGLLLLSHLRSPRAVGRMAVAAVPALLWLLFAGLYYGAPLPNTGAAKLGIYPDWRHAALRGLKYVVDWCLSEPAAAGASIALFLYVLYAGRRSRAAAAIAVGCALHGLWVVLIGGDFMRGRFFLPVFTALAFSGALLLLRQWKEAGFRPARWHGVLVLVAAVAGLIQSDRNARNWDIGSRAEILNERRYYPAYSLRQYLRAGTLENPDIDVSLATELRAYAAACGPVTVHVSTPGTIGYLAGPEVTVIDLLGLTDRTIAALPKSHQIKADPRPGHVKKYVPVAYLAERGDIALLPGWRERMRAQDCALKAEARSLRGSPLFWSPDGPVARPHLLPVSPEQPAEGQHRL